jgi:predicted acyltransferase
MTICFMIIVNSPGSWSVSYAPLQHAAWHGFTPTDLVFPSFVFAMGASMAFAWPRYEQLTGPQFWKKVLLRSGLIFLFGYLMYWFPFVQADPAGGLSVRPIAETRIFGVLQRIALCYLATAVVMRFGSRRSAIWLSAVALLGYWVLLVVFGDHGHAYSLAGNAELKLDRALLGDAHLYHGEGVPFDPEGILSTLPAVVNAIAGFLAGDFLRRRGPSYETITKLMLVGASLIALALAWHPLFPINKKIWTSSFVLLTVGIDLLLLPAMLYLIDLVGHRRWTGFFRILGSNPLATYILSELLLVTLLLLKIGDASVRDWLYVEVFQRVASPINASLLFAVTFMLACWTAAWALDRRGIYLRV